MVSSSFVPASEHAPCPPWVQRTERDSGKAGVVRRIPSGYGSPRRPGWRKPAATTEHMDPVAEVLWVGDWEVVDSSPSSFEKALRAVSSCLLNKAARIAAGPVGEFSGLA